MRASAGRMCANAPGGALSGVLTAIVFTTKSMPIWRIALLPVSLMNNVYDGDATIPQRWFVVFAREAEVWTPVHLHMAASAP